ncbi:hypothetical protein ABZ027_32225 [Streptomyces sp. NPDC006332]|uniref:hypothetical protein n=1 Tax=Streptomyces sp. NPDC006332 TaxID=3155456 RepID=UPI0033B4B250
MTHDPDQEHTAGGERPDRPSGAGPDWEVLAGPGGAEPQRPRDAGWRGLWQRRSTRVTAATAVAVLALGGTVAYAATSGDSDSGAPPAATASPSASPSPEGPGDRHGHGPRFGLGGDWVHGEATVKDRDSGKWVVRVWQRGTVEKADGDQVTVRSEDGAAWTWTVGADVKVFPGRGSGSDTLTKGDTAYLVGTRDDDGTRTARYALSGDRGDKGPGGWLDRLPGHDFREGRTPSPSGNGAGT